MIIEGILTTRNEQGGMHVSPLGPHVDPSLQSWTLKPFQSSTTFANLRRTPAAVFHVIDSSLLMADAVLGQAHNAEHSQLDQDRFVLSDCCHWFALSVDTWDVSEPRAIATASIRSTSIVRQFWGWNRAKHAVLEAAILASRKHLLKRVDVVDQLNQLNVWVKKTGGLDELTAFERLSDYLLDRNAS
jgi:hypothetical protein